jgi:hypothetical protein
MGLHWTKELSRTRQSIDPSLTTSQLWRPARHRQPGLPCASGHPVLVKEKLRCFSGNPNHITFFGESAGGTSVSSQVVFPLYQGLFHGAIMESGGSAANPHLQHL